jgi:hypothetical protein
MNIFLRKDTGIDADVEAAAGSGNRLHVDLAERVAPVFAH